MAEKKKQDKSPFTSSSSFQKAFEKYEEAKRRFLGRTKLRRTKQ